MPYMLVEHLLRGGSDLSGLVGGFLGAAGQFCRCGGQFGGCTCQAFRVVGHAGHHVAEALGHGRERLGQIADFVTAHEELLWDVYRQVASGDLVQ